MHIKDSLDYTGKVVLVTGGTKGIGATIAQQFLEAGAQVIVCGRQTPEHLPTAQDRTADFQAIDLRDTDALSAMFDYIAEHYGRLDVVVNNAGGCSDRITTL